MSLLNRVRMEGKNSKADLVLGLDNNLVQAAQKTGLFAESQVDASTLKLPGGWHNSTFVPFDYGYFAFVYDKTRLKNPPKSLKELVDSPEKWRVIYEDPVPAPRLRSAVVDAESLWRSGTAGVAKAGAENGDGDQRLE